MCNPAVLAFVPAMAQGVQQAMGNDTNKKTLEQNRTLLETQKRDALTRGNTAMENQFEKTRQTVGAQRADMGASGFDVNSGSNAQVQTQTAAVGERDLQTLRSNMLKEAWGYDVQIGNINNQLDALETNQTLLTGGLGTAKGRKFLTTASLTGGISAPWQTTKKMPHAGGTLL